MIQTIHEVWHFREPRVRLFEDYVNTWLKLKTETSGWPAWCDKEEKKQLYMTQFQEKEGIALEYEKIAANPGQQALAKLMLNSRWGKFGQQVNKMQVKEFIEPQSLFVVSWTLILTSLIWIRQMIYLRDSYNHIWRC